MAYLLLLPAFVFFVVFKFGAVLYLIPLSLEDWRLGSTTRAFVGLGNYRKLLVSTEFWNALTNTIVYTVAVGVLSIALGLVLALAVRRSGRLQGIYQAVFFLPVAATMSAMAVVWRFIFDTNIGVLNAMARAWGLSPLSWLQDDRLAMGAVVLIGVWSNMGYAMVLFLAGLTTISRDLYEAAAIDGASAPQQFRAITWPLLSPVTLFVVIILTLRAVQAFDSIKVLTNGGPLGATQVLSHLLFQVGFQYFDTGFASTISVVFFLLLAGVTLLQMRVERRVHYQ
ncbi:MAG: sugar ABC transporter permease [Armatimonadota bacterium]|nr:sugar ABC transporter permease [Armatimonadota bacterium]